MYEFIIIALGVMVGTLMASAVGLLVLMQPKVIKWYLAVYQKSVNEAIEEACTNLDL